MASEYLKWLARNEKPEEKRELTPKEKRKNWWDYHKFHVLAVTVVLIMLCWLVGDLISGATEYPDYQIAYFGDSCLPKDTAAALETALAQYGEDISGDGKVWVQIVQYFSAGDYYEEMRITADLGAGSSCLYLMENPKAVQAEYNVLTFPDGTHPEDVSECAGELWFAWSDCPVLSSLSLGTYNRQYDEVVEHESGSSQELLATLYVGRRGYGQMDEEKAAAYELFWWTLMQGVIE